MIALGFYLVPMLLPCYFPDMSSPYLFPPVQLAPKPILNTGEILVNGS